MTNLSSLLVGHGLKLYLCLKQKSLMFRFLTACVSSNGVDFDPSWVPYNKINLVNIKPTANRWFIGQLTRNNSSCN